MLQSQKIKCLALSRCPHSDPLLDSGGMFKDYDLHKIMSLSARIEEMPGRAEFKLLAKQVCYGSGQKVNYRKSDFLLPVGK